MEPYQIIILAAGIIAAIVIIGIITSGTAAKNLYYKLFSSYGQLKSYDFSYEEYESISHFFKNTLKDEFIIDDTTWNDLDMDKIFMMINNTNSSVGRDYLYKILRTPLTSLSELQERDRLIKYFDSDSYNRTKIMQAFAGIGFTRKISISDHMDRLFKLKPVSNVFHYAMLVCMLIAILYTIFIDPVMGILLILITFGGSIITYYKMKSKIDSFFTCIRQLVAMLNAAEKISGLNIPELKEYNERLNNAVHTFRKIKRNSWLLVSAKDKSGSLGDIFLEYLRMFTHLDLIKFNHMLKNIGSNEDMVIELMSVLGLLESMISVASFRKLLPYYCTPGFSQGDGGLSIKEVYHLSIKEPVANSINEDKPVLITGSNASGKSTFLKSVAICSILAQTIYTCPAEEYKAPFYRIYSSMALSDDLDLGESYYIVEIKSLKRIVDASQKEGARILCFIDEVLRGTNTVERIAASSEILRSLAKSNVMCFAATHDIELTHILQKYYANYHFDEEVRDNNVIFSYLLKNGKASSRNAIKLLEIIGYSNDIVNDSEIRANDFINTGVWRQCE